MTAGREKMLLVGVLGLVMPLGFVSVASLASGNAAPAPAWLVTPLDDAIPVVPVAVWAYASWYPASLVSLFVDRETFRRVCIAEFIAFLACSTMHLLWPISIERPSLDQYTGASADALRFLYSVDRPVSIFPSFHAAVAPILLQLRPPALWLRVLLATWMAAICISCVLTKQHFVLDVVAGLAVGWAASLVARMPGRTVVIDAGDAVREPG